MPLLIPKMSLLYGYSVGGYRYCVGNLFWVWVSNWISYWRQPKTVSNKEGKAQPKHKIHRSQCFASPEHAPTKDANATGILRTRPATTQISVSTMQISVEVPPLAGPHLPCSSVRARPARRSTPSLLASPRRRGWPISPDRGGEGGLDLASIGGFDGGGPERQSRGRRESRLE